MRWNGLVAPMGARNIREVAPDPWPLENEELLVAAKSQYNVVEQRHDE